MKRLPALMHSKELGSGSIALATGVMSGNRSEHRFAATERYSWCWVKPEVASHYLRKSPCNVAEIIAEGSDPPRLVRLIHSGNGPSLWWYFNEVRWRWIKSVKRRSQRAFMSWESSPASPTASSRLSGYYTRCPVTVSTPGPESKFRFANRAIKSLSGGLYSKEQKMGFLDNAVNKSVPQGSSLAKPLLLAFGALLASGALTGAPYP